MSDKYDDLVAHLTENPDEIFEAWSDPLEVSGGALFLYATPTGRSSFRGEQCGCLTQIRSGKLPAFTPELTAAIRADERIPTSGEEITAEALPVFAEWQRKLDREVRVFGR